MTATDGPLIESNPVRHNFQAIAAATLVTVWSVIGWSAVSPVRAAEVIERYDAAITVLANGKLDVTETIRVRAEGDRIKRGIYRDFPLIFRDAEDRERQVTFKLIDVLRDRKSEPHFTKRNFEGIRIYAGEENTFLPSGTYTYQFRYQTGRQLRFLPDHTELNWNVTGNEWDFPILKVTAVIRLPNDQTPVRWTAYTGRAGERGENYFGATRSSGGLGVSTNAPLKPGEGLTIVAELPAGLIPPPSQKQRLRWALMDNRRFILGGIGLAGLLAFYLSLWNAVGRDPPKGTIIPLFHPPNKLSPALTGYINDWGWRGGWQNFTAAMISLAVKGHLVFDSSGDDPVLQRVNDPQGRDHAGDRDGLPPGEQVILNWVDRKGGTVTIDKSGGASLATTFSSFKSRIEKECRGRFFRRNLGYFIAGLVITAITVIIVLVFGNLRETEIGLFIMTIVAFGIVGMFIVMPLVRFVFGGRGVRSIVGIGIKAVMLVIIGSGFIGPLFAGRAALPDDFGAGIGSFLASNAFPLILVGGFATLNGLFFYLLRAPTAAGRTYMDRIEGLEMYLRTAESARMNMAEAPDFSAEHFERLLPYAIALGAEKPWSDAFASAFARAHPGEDAAHNYRPRWHGGHGFAGGDFGRSMSGAMSAAQSSFSSSMPAPKSSSSGFSGGGGSGGGGGGGGGGGW